MTMTMPKGGGPLIVGAVLIGAAWFFSRRAQLAAAAGSASNLAARRPLFDAGRTAINGGYATPTSAAEQFARLGLAVARNLATAPPRDLAVGTADARRDVRAAELGYYGWTGPTIGQVDPIVAPAYGDRTGWAAAMDSIPGGPAFDPGQDVALEPWFQLGGP